MLELYIDDDVSVEPCGLEMDAGVAHAPTMEEQCLATRREASVVGNMTVYRITRKLGAWGSSAFPLEFAVSFMDDGQTRVVCLVVGRCGL